MSLGFFVKMVNRNWMPAINHKIISVKVNTNKKIKTKTNLNQIDVSFIFSTTASGLTEMI